MRTIWFSATISIIFVLTLTACGLIPTRESPALIQITEPPASPVPTEQATQAAQLPLVEIGTETFCYSGPGESFEIIKLLQPAKYLAGQKTEGESEWFKVDPNAIIDPVPPSSDPNTIFCWVSGQGLKLIGDFSQVPIVVAPRLGIVNPTACYAGPGAGYIAITAIDSKLFFDIVAIDDDVTWFQVDLNEIMDLNPISTPTNPVDSLSSMLCPPFYQETAFCWLPEANVVTSGDLSLLPVIEKPVIEVIKETGCFTGPGEEYSKKVGLSGGAYFELAGIDDDVTWMDNTETAIDDDVTWIDDDVTWVAINPNALVDPNPPHRPLNQLSPQPDPPGSQFNELCWVPISSVNLAGDVHSVPVILTPILKMTSKAYCNSGPGTDYKATNILSLDQFFKIYGRNTNTGWFQINPNALVDPDPPHRLLDEKAFGIAQNVRCWVPDARVNVCGELSLLPLVWVADAPKPTATATVTPVPEESGPKCSDFSNPTDCYNLGGNMGCVWDKILSKCYKP